MLYVSSLAQLLNQSVRGAVGAKSQCAPMDMCIMCSHLVKKKMYLSNRKIIITCSTQQTHTKRGVASVFPCGHLVLHIGLVNASPWSTRVCVLVNMGITLECVSLCSVSVVMRFLVLYCPSPTSRLKSLANLPRSTVNNA